MEMEIIKDVKNPLLKRREIEFRVKHDGNATPAKIEVAKLLAAKLNENLDTMIIKNYVTEYGTNKARGIAYIYESKEDMIRIEGKIAKNDKKRIGLKGEENETQA